MNGDAERIEIAAGDGIHLNVVRTGSGAPLLLLHGFTGSAETWTPVATLLRDRFTTLAVELPGHGLSDTPTDPARFALTSLADDFARILDTYGIERVAVLGYSMGGRAALQFALRHPTRVAALVLESASPGIVDPKERAIRLASDSALADAIERDGITAFVDRWERLPLWASQEGLPEETRAGLRAQRLANQPRGLANSLRGAGAGVEPATVDQLALVGMSTLLVVGSLDTKYVALAQLMNARMPLARTVMVDGCGHAVHLERPAEFADLVARFLDGVREDVGDWR